MVEMKRVVKICQLNIFPDKEYNRDSNCVLEGTFTENVKVTLEIGEHKIEMPNCVVDVYSPVYDITDKLECTGFGIVDMEKVKADKGEHIITLATKEPNKMIYVGFSQHDDESWYKCPVCNQQYGSWGFINGSVKVSDDGTFKCKCGTILVKPK